MLGYGYIQTDKLKADKELSIQQIVPIDKSYVRCARIEEGMKIYPSNNTEEECNKHAKILNKNGIETRVGCNIENGVWSIYIKSVLENYYDDVEDCND